MKRLWMIFLTALLFLPLQGCGRKAPAKPRVVTSIQVAWDQGYNVKRWKYTQPEKTTLVLDYLRLQKNLGNVRQDPERIRGDSLRITVQLSDGTEHIYYQRSGRFLSRNYHRWHKIEPKRAEAFLQTLRLTPTDG